MLSVGFRFVLCDVDGPQKEEDRVNDEIYRPWMTDNPWMTLQEETGVNDTPYYVNNPQWTNTDYTTHTTDTTDTNSYTITTTNDDEEPYYLYPRSFTLSVDNHLDNFEDDSPIYRSGYCSSMSISYGGV